MLDSTATTARRGRRWTRRDVLLSLGLVRVGTSLAARRRAASWLVWAGSVYVVFLACRWLFDGATRTFFIGGDLIRFWDNRSLSQALSHSWHAVLRPGSDAPLADLVYFVDRLIGGNDPYRFHLVLLGLHVLNAAAVFRLVRALRPRATWVSLAAATAFLVAPTNARTLNWAVLVPLLVGTLLLLTAVRRAVLWGVGGNRRDLGAAYALSALAALAGQSFLLAPLLVAVTLMSVGSLEDHDELPRDLRPRLLAAVPAVVLSAVVSAWFWSSRGASDGHRTVYNAATLSHNLVVYTDLWLQGWGLHVSDTVADMAGRACFAVALLAGYLLLSQAGRRLVYWIAWFPLLLVPLLFTTNDQHYYDTYPAQIGLAVAIVLALERTAQQVVVSRGGWRRWFVRALAAALFVLAGTQTYALASDANTNAEVTARSSRLLPWWQSLERAVPHPAFGTELVMLEGRNYFDIGEELSSDPGPGVNFLYDRPDLLASFPRNATGGLTELDRSDHPREVFLSSFFRNEGFVHEMTVDTSGAITLAPGWRDLLATSRRGVMLVNDEELVTVVITPQASPRPRQVKVTLVCAVPPPRPIAELVSRPVRSDGRLLLRVFQIPRQCGGVLTAEVRGAARSDVKILGRR